MSARNMSIYFTDRETEYWFTDRVFEVGEEFERGGKAWVVTSVDDSYGTGKHTSIRVRPAAERATSRAS
jgi:hypothetical protein